MTFVPFHSLWLVFFLCGWMYQTSDQGVWINPEYRSLLPLYRVAQWQGKSWDVADRTCWFRSARHAVTACPAPVGWAEPVTACRRTLALRLQLLPPSDHRRVVGDTEVRHLLRVELRPVEGAVPGLDGVDLVVEGAVPRDNQPRRDGRQRGPLGVHAHHVQGCAPRDLGEQRVRGELHR